MYFPLKKKTKYNPKRKKTSQLSIVLLKILFIFPTCARTLPYPYDAPSPTTFLFS